MRQSSGLPIVKCPDHVSAEFLVRCVTRYEQFPEAIDHGRGADLDLPTHAGARGRLTLCVLGQILVVLGYKKEEFLEF